MKLKKSRIITLIKIKDKWYEKHLNGIIIKENDEIEKKLKEKDILYLIYVSTKNFDFNFSQVVGKQCYTCSEFNTINVCTKCDVNFCVNDLESFLSSQKNEEKLNCSNCQNQIEPRVLKGNIKIFLKDDNIKKRELIKTFENKFKCTLKQCPGCQDFIDLKAYTTPSKIKCTKKDNYFYCSNCLRNIKGEKCINKKCNHNAFEENNNLLKKGFDNSGRIRVNKTNWFVPSTRMCPKCDLMVIRTGKESNECKYTKHGPCDTWFCQRCLGIGYGKCGGHEDPSCKEAPCQIILEKDMKKN